MLAVCAKRPATYCCKQKRLVHTSKLSLNAGSRHTCNDKNMQGDKSCGPCSSTEKCCAVRIHPKETCPTTLS